MKPNITQACSSALQNLGENRDGISLPEKSYSPLSGVMLPTITGIVDKIVQESSQVCVVDGCEHLGQPCECCEALYCEKHSVTYNRQRLCVDCAEDIKLEDYRNGGFPELDYLKDQGV